MTGDHSTYDPTLFQSTAPYYARYRKWPAELFTALKRVLSLDGHGSLLDLGCGTGQLSIPLSSQFEDVVGIDPDRDMIDGARRQAAAAGVRNVTWMQARAEDLPLNLGTFRLITIGGAFHWMDRARILDTLYSLVSQDGVVAIIDSEENMSPDPWPVIKKLLRHYVGEERRAGRGVYKHPEERHESLVRRSRFGRVEIVAVPFETVRSEEDLVGWLYSTSFASRRVLGSAADKFDRDLHRELSHFNQSSWYREHGEVRVILARR